MQGLLDAVLERMLSLPAGLVAAVLAAAAALENIVPPIPADVVVLFGGFLTARTGESVWLVFLAVWGGNVAGALLVYSVGRRYGRRIFGTRWGSYLLRPRQLAQLDDLYRNRGTVVLFISRFLPIFRALVPAFAGMSGVGWVRAAVPIAAASALWYGLIIYVGATAGRNWDVILHNVQSASRWLAFPAVILVLLVIGWWWRTRGAAEP